MYGLCKYGPTCKYDHPLLGYSYNYSVNLPTLSMPDPSLFPYQRNLPMIHSYETSPSKSPKFPDWMGKFEAAGNRKWNAKSPEELSEQAGSPSNSSSALAEQPNDHSDWNPKSIILLFYISRLATEGYFFGLCYWVDVKQNFMTCASSSLFTCYDCLRAGICCYKASAKSESWRMGMIF